MMDSVSSARETLRRAFGLHQQGHLEEARTAYRKALASDPQLFDALHMLGVLELQTRRPDRAVELLRKAIALSPRRAAAHNNLGNALRETGQSGLALDCYERAIRLDPNQVDAHCNLAGLLNALNRPGDALQHIDEAARLNPHHPGIPLLRGIAFYRLGRVAPALDQLQRATAINPHDADAYLYRGAAEDASQQYQAALSSYDRAIALRPGYSDAYNNRGLTLFALHDYQGALASFDSAIVLDARRADARVNRGNVLRELGRFAESLESYDAALAIDPRLAAAYVNRGTALYAVYRYEEAISDYDTALALSPEMKSCLGVRLHAQMQICRWHEVGAKLMELGQQIERGDVVCNPGFLVALSGSLDLQRKAAETWVRKYHPSIPELPRFAAPRADGKIRIGYFSADFHDHATMYLMAEIFERHDRSRFEVTAFSFGPDSPGEMRRRMLSGCDHFLEVRERSDDEVASIARSREIDIAVDLKGFTLGGRPGIFARRAAPIQIQYLGYPATMGAEYIDYLVADPILIPPESRRQYAERIIYLPDSYQANDSKRRIGAVVQSREALGLPAAGFVFCCFNNSFKITPDVFDAWMRIMHRVEGSVLWLLADNPAAVANLRGEAVDRGLGTERLIFAPRTTLPEHLARQRAADLFLDTLPYNAHTTASDALWAGVPVLTCLGESFASRVAASLLTAVGLPELIATTPARYEDLAVELSTRQGFLTSLRARLAKSRDTVSLFDARRFTRHLESAYGEIHSRHRAGLPLDHVFVGNAGAAEPAANSPGTPVPQGAA